MSAPPPPTTTMALTGAPPAAASPMGALRYFTFSQDHSFLCVGSVSGFTLYGALPFTQVYHEDCGAIGVVEMLFGSTALVALVGSNVTGPGERAAFSPHWLRLVNTKRKSTLCELKFPTPILAVKLNRKRVVVVLNERIDIFDIANMSLLQTLSTATNVQGLCALSPSHAPCLLAYPSNIDGEVLIHDTDKSQPLRAIQAHSGPVECVSFSPQGDLIATASDKGTLIRVMNVESGARVHFFRRGTLPATITDISFSNDACFLAISSTSETVHIFKLGQEAAASASWSSAAMAYVPRAYLPSMVTDLIEPWRNFAYAKVPEIGAHTICAVHPSSGVLQVVTSSGVLYEYTFDTAAGGEAKFNQKFSILPSQS